MARGLVQKGIERYGNRGKNEELDVEMQAGQWQPGIHTQPGNTKQVFVQYEMQPRIFGNQSGDWRSGPSVGAGTRQQFSGQYVEQTSNFEKRPHEGQSKFVDLVRKGYDYHVRHPELAAKAGNYARKAVHYGEKLGRR